MNDFTRMHNDYLDPDKYGLFDEEMDNSAIVEAFQDYDSLASLYRAVYKYTPCGPNIGALIHYYIESTSADPDDYGSHEVSKWFYGDDLRQFGTFKDMDEHGSLVLELAVSSIIEGVDQTTDTVKIDCNGLEHEPEEIRDNFWNAVEEVDKQATAIWNDTHGCETCAVHFSIDLEAEYSPVWPECPDCEGSGIVI